MPTNPAVLLRIEGGITMAAAFALYRAIGGGWLLFIALILAPDVFMLGYLRGARLGAALYNFAHTEAIPILMAVISWELHRSTAVAIALIWVMHIGADRALGFGLKYPTHFKDTHLQRV